MLMRMWSNRNSCSLLVGIQNGTATLEDSFLQNQTCSYHMISNCALSGIYQKKLRPYIYTKTSIQKFKAALFITAKAWKQSRCPLVTKWIHKLWYIQTVKCYSAPKRNELSSHEKIWRTVTCVLLSERSPSENATYCLIPTRWNPGKDKTRRINKSMVARGWGRGEMN